MFLKTKVEMIMLTNQHLKVYGPITYGFIHPYFSHYACENLRATDIACKSYKRKRSESSVTTIITIHEFSLRFHL